MDIQNRPPTHRQSESAQERLTFYGIHHSLIVGSEWDNIARSYNQTRQRPWEEVVDFMAEQTGHGLVIACGNGRHLLPLAQHCNDVVGLDASAEMARITSERIAAMGVINAAILVGTATALPFRPDTFDCVLFIAGLHNIKGRRHRIQALQELNRVLNHSGKALISVWALWQDRFRWTMARQLFTPWKTRGDILVPWKRNGSPIMRFYHLYTKGKLLKDLKTAGLRVVRIWSVAKTSRRHPDNHFVMVERGPSSEGVPRQHGENSIIRTNMEQK